MDGLDVVREFFAPPVIRRHHGRGVPSLYVREPSDVARRLKTPRVRLVCLLLLLSTVASIPRATSAQDATVEWLEFDCEEDRCLVLNAYRSGEADEPEALSPDQIAPLFTTLPVTSVPPPSVLTPFLEKIGLPDLETLSKTSNGLTGAPSTIATWNALVYQLRYRSDLHLRGVHIRSKRVSTELKRAYAGQGFPTAERPLLPHLTRGVLGVLDGDGLIADEISVVAFESPEFGVPQYDIVSFVNLGRRPLRVSGDGGMFSGGCPLESEFVLDPGERAARLVCYRANLPSLLTGTGRATLAYESEGFRTPVLRVETVGNASLLGILTSAARKQITMHVGYWRDLQLYRLALIVVAAGTAILLLVLGVRLAPAARRVLADRGARAAKRAASYSAQFRAAWPDVRSGLRQNLGEAAAFGASLGAQLTTAGAQIRAWIARESQDNRPPQVQAAGNDGAPSAFDSSFDHEVITSPFNSALGHDGSTVPLESPFDHDGSAAPSESLFDHEGTTQLFESHDEHDVTRAPVEQERDREITRVPFDQERARDVTRAPVEQERDNEGPAEPVDSVDDTELAAAAGSSDASVTPPAGAEAEPPLGSLTGPEEVNLPAEIPAVREGVSRRQRSQSAEWLRRRSRDLLRAAVAAASSARARMPEWSGLAPDRPVVNAQSCVERIRQLAAELEARDAPDDATRPSRSDIGREVRHLMRMLDADLRSRRLTPAIEHFQILWALRLLSQTLARGEAETDHLLANWLREAEHILEHRSTDGPGHVYSAFMGLVRSLNE